MHPAVSTSIWTESSGRPGTKVGDLSNAGDSPVDVSAETTYFVVFDSDGTGGGAKFPVTTSDAEDGTSQSGWSLGNTYLFRDADGSGSWRSSSSSLKIELGGTVKSGDNTPPVVLTNALVSNTAETIGTVHLEAAAAPNFQGFTTGSNSEGYTLETVTVIAYATDDDDATADLVLKLCTAKADGRPDTTATCTDLGTVDFGDLPTETDCSGGTVTVDPTDFDLAKDTTYFVSFGKNGTTAGPVLCTTASDAQDGVTGWSIEDAFRASGGNNDLSPGGAAYVIRVGGTVKGATDTTAPTVSSAAADGASLVITFDENLAAATNLANGAFAVTKGSGDDTVALSSTAPSISGATVTLTLASALAPGDTNVKVSYTKPGTGTDNKLKDAADNEVASFSGQAVTNNTNAPPTASDSTVETKEDAEYTFQSSDFNFSDTDSGDALEKVKIVTVETAGDLELDGTDVTANQEVTKAELDNGKLIFTPATEDNGASYATFTFKVNDGDDDSASAYTMTIDVDSVPDANTVAVITTPISGTTPKKYGAGEQIGVVVIFDEAVTVTGDPVINVEVGTNSRPAAYATGSGSTRLVFGYTVIAEDSDSDGISIDANALTLDANDKIEGSDNDTAVIMHAALPAQSGHKVDGTLTPPFPTATDGEVSAKEDTAYTFQAGDFNYMDSGNALTHVIVTSLPGKGTLTLDGTAIQEVDLDEYVIASRLGTTRGLTWEPPADENGNDFATFSFQVQNAIALSASAYTMTIDVDPVPDVTDVAVTSTPTSGTTPKKYGAGEKIQVTATFDEAVTVTGDPVINVEVGSNSRPAAYASGSGTTELVFEYTVVSGDSDSDGVSIDANALTLDADSGSEDYIRDGDGNDADITHAALAAQSGHQVDGSLTPPVADANDELDNTLRAVFDKTAVTVDEGGTAKYTVKLSGAPPATGVTSVRIVSGDEGAATVNPDSLSFTTSTWSTAQEVTVTGVEDRDVQDETVTLAHSVVYTDPDSLRETTLYSPARVRR